MIDNKFSSANNLKDKINYWLKYAVMAPSAHNTQPWKCILNDGVLEIYRDEAFTLESDSTSRLAHIGIGAFIENFVIAARACGYYPEVDIVAFAPSELLVAKIRVVKKNHLKIGLEKELFNVIANRSTNRGYYKSGDLDEELKDTLISNEMSLVKSFVFCDINTKKRISQLVAIGTRVALTLKFMKKELANYVYSNREPKDTGMPINSMVSSSLIGALSPRLAIKYLNPDSLARENNNKYASSPAVVIIGSTEEGPAAWINSGRLMERLLLISTKNGLSHDIAAAPIEIPTLTPLLRKEIPLEFRPQVLFRLGYPKIESLSIRSGRRPISI